MGKITGFLEHTRELPQRRLPSERIGDWFEIYQPFPEASIVTQAGRCMDCGVPFCHTGCPLTNIIPDWNDLVYRGRWREAIRQLHTTNNFPEFTSRICPAPCEASCVLGISEPAVTIKQIEKTIVDRGFEEGFIKPEPAASRTGKRVAVIGSGPAGLAAAQQLARAGHEVTVFEKNDRIGGLLRYGIPNFKLEKWLIDRRMRQMEAEGVAFRTNVFIGRDPLPGHIANSSRETISPDELREQFDAVVIAGGSETPRDLPVPGREMQGIHYAMEFLPLQNRVNADDTVVDQLIAKGKHVVVIGGGDTGSDCVGTSNRHGAKSVTQFELLSQPPEVENKPLVWPYWPIKLRTSSSHEEGCERDWSVATKRFEGKNGKVEKLIAVRVEWKDGKMQEVAGSEFEMKADLVLLAMGFTQPTSPVLEAFGVDKDARGNVKASTEGAKAYFTSVPKVFTAGDMRRGQSLVVWAIREGRQCARSVDAFLMGSSELPR